MAVEQSEQFGQQTHQEHSGEHEHGFHGGEQHMEHGDPAANRFREQADMLGEDLRGLADSAMTVARNQLTPLEEQVRDRPMQSLLIAAGVGALIGFIMRGR